MAKKSSPSSSRKRTPANKGKASKGFWASAKTWFTNQHKASPKRLWLLILPGILALLGAFLVALLIGSVYVGLFGQLPSRDSIASVETPEASWLLDRNGEVLSRYYEQNRDNVDINELSPDLLAALLATEDERFFEHEGVDWKATARAIVFTGLLGKTEQGGGSTLSQQLAKNHFPRTTSGKMGMLVTKIKEAFTASRFEEEYSKEELLALYLNTVPFGENMYGVKVASNRFFGVDPIDLKVEEAAVLVGMLKANSGYHPVWHPEKSKKRRNLVLRRMMGQELLTQVEYDSLSSLPLKLNEKRDRARARTSYLSDRVKADILKMLDLNDSDIDPREQLSSGGLRIYTSIDEKVQRMAEKSLQDHLAEMQPRFFKHWKGRDPLNFDEPLQANIRASHRFKHLRSTGLTVNEALASFGESREITYADHSALGARKIQSSWKDSVRSELLRLRASFMVADPKTQDILAYVGGTDYFAVPFNSAIANRQVGSTFKPLVYATAIERGMSPCDYLPNELRTYTDYDDWTPENSGGEYGGEYSLTGGIVGSVNTIAVQLIFAVGPEKVKALAAAMGVTDVPAEPSIALGTPSLTLEEMIRVYGTFARAGRVPDFDFITRIETRSGKVLYEREAKEDPNRVFNSRTAEFMDYMLRQVATRGTGRGLTSRYGVQSEVAGKTGTTQNQADGWFMGYTDDLVVGAWVGGAYPTIRWRNLTDGQGARTALPIVGKFLRSYEKKYGVSQLPDLREDLLMEVDCQDFISYDDSLFDDEGDTEIDFDAIFKKLFKEQAERKVENPRSNRTSEQQRRQDAQRRSNEEKQRKRQERAAEQRQRERLRKKDARQKKVRKVLDKVFKKN
ncbi:MAG: transglycosylase domain-containing protein [Saprospiraceae bacterium]